MDTDTDMAMDMLVSVSKGGENWRRFRTKDRFWFPTVIICHVIRRTDGWLNWMAMGTLARAREGHMRPRSLLKITPDITRSVYIPR
jgi:hypothetical protein